MGWAAKGGLLCELPPGRGKRDDENSRPINMGVFSQGAVMKAHFKINAENCTRLRWNRIAFLRELKPTIPFQAKIAALHR